MYTTSPQTSQRASRNFVFSIVAAISLPQHFGIFCIFDILLVLWVVIFKKKDQSTRALISAERSAVALRNSVIPHSDFALQSVRIEKSHAIKIRYNYWPYKFCILHNVQPGIIMIGNINRLLGQKQNFVLIC